MERWIQRLLWVSFGVALFTFLFHDIIKNPQYDTQVIQYGYQLITGVRDGTLLNEYLEARKYPLGYAIPFAALYSLAKYTIGLSLPIAHVLSRGLTIAYAVGTLLLLRNIGHRIFKSSSAPILLATSILFFLFATAIRPHVPVTFWTMLAYSFAIQPKKHLLSFAAATMAACTLQNGFLAFIFPVWAMLRFPFPDLSAMSSRPNGGGGPGRGGRNVLWIFVLLFACLLLTILFGYPFILARLFDAAVPVSIDLGHNVGIQFDVLHPLFILKQLLGSELFLLLFAGASIVLWVRSRMRPAKELFPAFLYILLTFLLFAPHPISDGRFFLPTFPFLALIGTEAHKKSPPIMRIALLLFMIAVFVKFALLGDRANTFQQAAKSLEQVEGKIGGHGAAAYFLNLPDGQLAKTIDETDYIVIPDIFQKHPKGNWALCARVRASSWSDENMFLWVEVRWALLQLFVTERLGPNLSVFCRTTG